LSDNAFLKKRIDLIRLLIKDNGQLARMFAHLYAYFDVSLGGVGLANLENELLTQKIEPFMLSRRANDFPNLLVVLQTHVGDRGKFEVAAAGYLKEVDYRLSHESQSLIAGEYGTFDDRRCFVRKRNNYLATMRESIASAEDDPAERPRGPRGQGLSLFPYASRCICIQAPTTTEPLQIQFVKLDWETELRLCKIASSNHPDDEYRVLMWAPPDIAFRHADLLNPQNEPYVSLNEPTNLDIVESALKEGFELALKLRATVLIFPELTVPPSTEQWLIEMLDANANVPPFLVVFGRTHRPSTESDLAQPLDLNQGVVLGHAGQIVCIHDKLTTYGEIPPSKPISVFGRSWPKGISERNEKGQLLYIIETSTGVVCPLVCKDLLNPGIEEFIGKTHIDTVFMPSLSPQTKAHRDVANRLLLRQLASSFVSNRCLEPVWHGCNLSWSNPDGSPRDCENLLGVGASFFVVPGKIGGKRCVVCGNGNPTGRFLLFCADSGD